MRISAARLKCVSFFRGTCCLRAFFSDAQPTLVEVGMIRYYAGVGDIKACV